MLTGGTLIQLLLVVLNVERELANKTKEVYSIYLYPI